MKKPYFLYIINSAGICLFSYNFKRKFEIFEAPLFSGFITAVSKFSEELNRQLTLAENVDRIPSIPINKSFEIMISYTKSLIGAMIVEKKDIDEDMIYFLEELMNEFISKYQVILSNWDDDISQFRDFKDEIERIFKKVTIFSFQIPKLKNGLNSKFLDDEDYVNIVKMIDGKKDINDLSQQIGKSVSKTKDMISKLLWDEVISLSEKVYEDDIFEPKRDLFYLIRSQNYDLDIENLEFNTKKKVEFELLKAINGYKTIYDLSEDFKNLTFHEIKHIISFYLSQGSYLEKVDLYPQIININDEARDNLPAATLALSYSLENICDGELSLTEISKRIDVPIKKIKQMLDLLENQVTYKKKYKK